ncbi:peptide ABC transporter substrate-binding protein [Candidatus Parabeggiatoa sp. HSG14]|uniref:peptide ABC transporter substrate-binding protein n=1 Tax=Candidatus Parabeggiatoa sp. HSG14 TaxID=3055593 RepID=UPI0025A71EE6|nr:peptide ABC transporter substrate-binding protein [Thiotrichales bacterium HSG14]
MSQSIKQLILVLLLGSVIISGFNHHEAQSQTNQSEEHPNYLQIPLDNSVSTIDPGLVHTTNSIEVVEQLFLGLSSFEPKTYKVVPELATKWQVNEDRTVYTFQLRQDAKWSNGDPVTAHDIVWAVRRNLAQDSNFVYMLHILKNAKAIKNNPSLPLGIRAIDDYTVEFTLEHAASYFPAMAGLWMYRPLPSRIIKNNGKNWIEPKHIQTNGPYQLTKWHKNEKLVLQKNPHYYDADKVLVPAIHYRIISNPVIGLAMYEHNELDIIGGVYLALPKMEIPDIGFDATLRREIHYSVSFCTEFYGFNTRKPPMDNLLVRKAIAAAVDKQVINDFVVWGIHTPATTFTSPPIFGSVDPQEKVGISFDPKQAKAWLAEAGYPKGNGFPEVVLLYNILPNGIPTDIANAVKQMLKYYLNIDIVIKGIEDEYEYYQKIEQPNTPHIFRMYWCTEYPDANNWLYEAFHPSDGYQWVGWNNRDFAEAVEKAQRISDPKERQKLYRRAEEILTEEQAAIVPLFFINTQCLVKPWVKGWYNMAFGGQHIRNWQLEKGGK